MAFISTSCATWAQLQTVLPHRGERARVWKENEEVVLIPARSRDNTLNSALH